MRIIVQTEIAGRFEIFCAHSQFSTLTLSVETIADSFFLELQFSENVNGRWHLSSGLSLIACRQRPLPFLRTVR